MDAWKRCRGWWMDEEMGEWIKSNVPGGGRCGRGGRRTVLGVRVDGWVGELVSKLRGDVMGQVGGLVEYSGEVEVTHG